MRTIFMGAPPFAVPSLARLAALGAEIIAVYTTAPKPAGRRGLELTKTAVHLKAEALGLSVLTPATLRSEEALGALLALKADVAIVAAYGLILPPAALAAPAYGCLNLHGSLLPRWRGAAPVQRAIMAGDSRTGVGLMRMEAGLDTGPVAGELETPIDASDTAGDLTHRLGDMAADLLERCWPQIVAQQLSFRAQPDVGVTYAAKIAKSECAIDWRAEAGAVRNQIHGLSPAPGAFALVANGGEAERLKFLRVETVEGEGEPGSLIGPNFRIACGSGAIRAQLVQRAGKPPARADEVWRGMKLAVGDKFLGSL